MVDDGSAALTIGQALQIAVKAQREGKLDQAAGIYGQILSHDPDNGDALHLLGTLEMGRGRLEAAEQFLRRAVEAHPEVPAFKASLAKTLYLTGRTDEGLRHAARALADAPDNPGIREVANLLLRTEPALDLLELADPLVPIQASAAPEPGKCQVIGMAVGYAVPALRAFVRSLREVYAGPVHLFIDDNAAVQAFLDAHHINWSLVTASSAHPVLSRFALYRSFIETLDEDVRILLTDVSDVIFQGHPFQFSGDEPLVGVLEDPSVSLGACPWNSDWLRTHFGVTMLTRLSARRISCIGTIFGSRAGLKDYLTQLCLSAATLPVPAIYGLDTAIHNVLLHHRTVPGTAVLENGWPVATVQHMAQSAIEARDGGIRLADGRLPLIVHQYNRRQSMLDLVKARYQG